MRASLSTGWLRTIFLSYPFLALAGLAIGYLVFAGLVARPKVAVINVAYAELYSETVAQVSEVLKYVRDDRSVKAVVIKLNSPGGSLTGTLDAFMNTMELREKKPVVVLVKDIAASGGYMWLLGANYVIANPASMVGNVGAYMELPGRIRPEERVVPSGPFKLSGGADRTYIELLEIVKNGFVQLVLSQRGERLRITAEELSEGRIYVGLQASRLGLVDALGTEVDAVEKAASLARIRNYSLVDVNEEMKKRGISLAFSQYAINSTRQVRMEFPYIHYLFWEPQ